MADINQFIPFIFKWEGGFVNDPLDAGGATNMGVTLKTWQRVGDDKNNDGLIDEDDLKLIFQQDLIESVLRPHYWDRWQADKIRNQSIAHILVDWLWTSGTAAIKIPQRILNVDSDGIVGERTLAAVNNHPSQQDLFEQIKSERKAYVEKICVERPANKRFKKGWLNRLADIQFMTPVLLIALCFCFTACGSPAKAFQSNSEILAGSKEETVVVSENQTDYAIATQSDWQTNEATVEETVIVKFDTSILKDSVTGMHPVKEIVMKNLTKGTENLSTTVSLEQEYRSQSGIEVVEEQLQIAEKESTQSQIKPDKTSLNYWLFVFALTGCIFLYLFLCKKRY